MNALGLYIVIYCCGWVQISELPGGNTVHCTFSVYSYWFLTLERLDKWEVVLFRNKMILFSLSSFWIYSPSVTVVKDSFILQASHTHTQKQALWNTTSKIFRVRVINLVEIEFAILMNSLLSRSNTNMQSFIFSKHGRLTFSAGSDWHSTWLSTVSPTCHHMQLSWSWLAHANINLPSRHG